MGSQYNVRVPFVTMGQSVGRQIAEKKDRGFSANMRRLNEAIAPHAIQYRDHKNKMDLEAERFDNEKERIDYQLSTDLQKYDALRQRETEQGWADAAKVKAFQEQYADDPASLTDYGTMRSFGLPKEDIEGMQESKNKDLEGRRISQQIKTSEAQEAASKLDAQESRLSLRAIIEGFQGYGPKEKAEYQKHIDQLNLLDKTGESAARYNKLMSEASTARDQAIISNLAAQNAVRRQAYQGRLDKLELETAEMNKAIAAAGLDETTYNNLQSRQETATGTAKKNIEHYDELIADQEAELAGAQDPTTKRTLERVIEGLVDTRNAYAKGIEAPLVMLDEHGAVSLDYESTQAMIGETEAIKNIAAQTDNPELLAQSLLRQLDINSLDTQFLARVPGALLAAGKEPGFILRVQKAYLAEKDDIISQRRAKEVADRPKNVPRTTGDVTSGAEEKDKRKKKDSWYQSDQWNQWSKNMRYSIPGQIARPFSAMARKFDKQREGGGNVVRSVAKKYGKEILEY